MSMYDCFLIRWGDGSNDQTIEWRNETGNAWDEWLHYWHWMPRYWWGFNTTGCIWVGVKKESWYTEVFVFNLQISAYTVGTLTHFQLTTKGFIQLLKKRRQMSNVEALQWVVFPSLIRGKTWKSKQTTLNAPRHCTGNDLVVYTVSLNEENSSYSYILPRRKTSRTLHSLIW